MAKIEYDAIDANCMPIITSADTMPGIDWNRNYDIEFLFRYEIQEIYF